MSDRKIRTAILVSGGGSNLEAILQAVEDGRLPRIEVVLVLSSRRDAYALTRAKNHNVASVVVSPKDFANDELFQDTVLKELQLARVDLVCLAGYLRKLSPRLIHAYPKRILNIHPGLLPTYGGAGMYGHHVHSTVLAAGEKESGCSVHLVDEEFDHGPVLAEKRVAVLPGDTAESLAARILEQEHKLYPEVIHQFSETLEIEK